MSPGQKRKRMKELIKIKVGVDNIKQSETPTNFHYDTDDPGENNSNISNSERQPMTASPNIRKRKHERQFFGSSTI